MSRTPVPESESGLSEEYKTFNRGISQPGINVYILTHTFIL